MQTLHRCRKIHPCDQHGIVILKPHCLRVAVHSEKIVHFMHSPGQQLHEVTKSFSVFRIFLCNQNKRPYELAARPFILPADPRDRGILCPSDHIVCVLAIPFHGIIVPFERDMIDISLASRIADQIINRHF